VQSNVPRKVLIQVSPGTRNITIEANLLAGSFELIEVTPVTSFRVEEIPPSFEIGFA